MPASRHGRQPRVVAALAVVAAAWVVLPVRAPVRALARTPVDVSAPTRTPAQARAAEPAWRTLALAAFDDTWSTINDTFYDPSFGGVDWAALRGEYRARALQAPDPEAVRTIIREMIARLGRSHFALLSSAPEEEDVLPGPALVPIDVRAGAAGMLVTRVRDVDAARVQTGDVLVRIDGRDVDDVPGGHTPEARRARLEAWRDVNRRLHGAVGSTARLEVRGPDGRPREVGATRVNESGQTVRFGNLPALTVRVDTREVRTPEGRRVGVIGFNIWMAAINGPVARAMDTYRDAAGLVIDLRGNPGGLAEMIRGIAGHLLDEPVVLGRMQTRAAPLTFTANPRRATADGRLVDPYDGPVAILVDALTASASECFAGALQSLGRVHVVGRRTMGQALPAVTRRLPNGDALMYAIGDFVTATGVALEGDGVQPDEVVALTPEGLAGGQDPDLMAALRWIDAKSGR
ncbi:MAG: S41 family peptidase [Vicinamibacterales bacterium]